MRHPLRHVCLAGTRLVAGAKACCQRAIQRKEVLHQRGVNRLLGVARIGEQAFGRADRLHVDAGLATLQTAARAACCDIGEEVTGRPVALFGVVGNGKEDVIGQLVNACEETLEERTGCGGVIQRTVGAHQRDVEAVAEFAETVAAQPGQKNHRQIKRVDGRALKGDAAGAQKAHVKVGVMRNHGADISRDEGAQFGQHLLEAWRIGDVGIADACELLNARGDRALGVDKRLEAVEDNAVRETDGANFHDGVALGLQAGGLQVKRNVNALGHGVGRPFQV